MKLYQAPDKSLNNPYARAMVRVFSPLTGSKGSIGDSYVSEVNGLKGKLQRIMAADKAATQS